VEQDAPPVLGEDGTGRGEPREDGRHRDETQLGGHGSSAAAVGEPKAAVRRRVAVGPWTGARPGGAPLARMDYAEVVRLACSGSTGLVFHLRSPRRGCSFRAAPDTSNVYARSRGNQGEKHPH